MGRTRQVGRGAKGSTALPLGRVLGHVERHTTRLIEGEIAHQGLTVDQWRVLDILADGEGHPMSELAGTIVVPGPTLTKIVDKLVDAALVYRLVDDRDRRRVLAFLSKKGQQVHADLAPVVANIEQDIVSRLGSDGSVLVELLGELARQYAGDSAGY
ncbi:MarR family winged helix-turn-helix transcriptional regulator [Amycolatopsis alkalitolerans]|nr:MarR family winged helix-turn-helix transcriptional regulator [Amycolatopsis alkalitolerans]